MSKSRASRVVGILIVLAAAFSAAYWVGGPAAPTRPEDGPPEREGTEGQPPERSPEREGERGPPEERTERPPEPPPDAQVEAGRFNPEFLPKPSPSYNDDPQRFAKTYQRHAQLASPRWRQLSELVKDPELAGKARGLSERLGDPNTDPLETTHVAIMLENELRESGAVPEEGKMILDYLNQITATVIQDGEPEAIEQPR
jgi:hypothetical protein